MTPTGRLPRPPQARKGGRPAAWPAASRRPRWRFGAGRWLAVAFLLLLHAAVRVVAAPPDVILYYSGAATVREAFREDRPNLQALLRESGVALMVTGPYGTDPHFSLQSGRYVTMEQAEHADMAPWPAGVLRVLESRQDPAAGDRLLGELRRRYPDAAVVALHSAPPRIAGAPRRLAVPAWIAVSGQHGRLYSDTVRRAGVVSILDARPTVERLAEGEYDRSLPGRPAWGDGRKDDPVVLGLPYHLERAVRLQDSLAVMARVSDGAFAALGVGGGLLLLASIALVWPSGRLRRGRGIVRYGFTALLALPAAYVLAAGRQPGSAAAFWVVAVLATGAVWLFAAVLGRLLSDSAEDAAPAMLQIAVGASLAVIAADVLRHGYGLLLSPLSNLYLTGIRFYGMGNEYAALFAAYAVLFGMLTVQRARTARVGAGGLGLLGAWLVAAGLFVGWPAYGANFGGMLACLAAGGAAWALVARRSGARFAWAWPAIFGAAAVAFVVWTDARSPQATHVGRFAHGVAAGGAGPAAVLRGKASIFTNVLLSGWTAFCLLLGAALALLLRGPLAPTARALGRRWTWVALSLPALLCGGVFGMLVNDSGAVVLGLMAAVPLAALAALALAPAE